MAAKTKITLLDLGRSEADEGFMIRGRNASTVSNPCPRHERRDGAIIAAVIEHPLAGPLLFETGAAEGAHSWAPELRDLFPLTTYDERHHLDVALENAGYSLSDIRGIILGHLHLDHAGGLEKFRGSDIPIWAHEEEIKTAYFAIATNEDEGAYLQGDLDLNLNWQPIQRDELELFDGLTLRHMPGHTPGLMTLQVETVNSGHFMFTSDLYHLRDLYEQDLAPGWLGRDSHGWFRSHRWMKHLARRYDATMVFGHDATVLDELLVHGSFD